MGLVGAKNQAMAGSYNQLPGGLGRAGKWARTRLLDIEAKRQSTTTGLAGAFFNPVGRGAKMEAEKKLKLNKKIVGIKTGETRQTLEALDAVSPGGDYLGLSDEERDKIKTSHPELAERYKQQEAELVWRGRQAFKEEDIHDFPLPSTLQKKVETGAEKNAKQEDAP